MELLEFTDIEQVRRFTDAMPVISKFLEDKLNIHNLINFLLAGIASIIYALWEVITIALLIYITAITIYKLENRKRHK